MPRHRWGSNMEFNEKLQLLRKEMKLSQEEVAEQLNVTRQAVAKWESGKVYPDIYNLIGLSDLFKVTIDSIVKNNTECTKSLIRQNEIKIHSVIPFLCTAKKKTYAGNGSKELESCRLNSSDLKYKENDFLYFDTYLGNERFTGEEAVWEGETPVWSMNYTGRVLEEQFSGDFLTEALSLVPYDSPYRGPSLYKNGDYTYHCNVVGDFTWFHGSEEIFYRDIKVYECLFHGGNVI